MFMKPEAIQAAKASNDFIYDALGAEYADMQASIERDLCVVGVSLESLNRKDKNDRANAELLVDFVRNLPSANLHRDKPRHKFFAHTSDQVKAFKGNSIWIHNRPHYVVGHDSTSGVLAVEARLSYENNDSSNDVILRKMEPTRRKDQSQVQKLITDMEQAGRQVVTDTTLTNLYDRNAQAFTVEPSGEKGWWTHVNIIDRLSDEDMARFHVVHHLSRLALVFNAHPALNDCYDKMARTLGDVTGDSAT